MPHYSVMHVKLNDAEGHLLSVFIPILHTDLHQVNRESRLHERTILNYLLRRRISTIMNLSTRQCLQSSKEGLDLITNPKGS